MPDASVSPMAPRATASIHLSTITLPINGKRCSYATLFLSDSLVDLEDPHPLPRIAVDEPTLALGFMVNDGPFYGRDGKYVTSRQVRERLYRAAERDVALRLEEASPDTFRVSGRGILHLSILMETMRREGYEFMVGQPRVIYKEINGRKAEPGEVLTVDVPAASRRERRAGRAWRRRRCRRGPRRDSPAGP